MPKGKEVEYVCENCDSVYAKWLGKCPSCGEFNTLIERARAQKAAPVKPKSAKHAARAAMVSPSGGQAIPLNDIRTKDFPKILLNSAEINNVLGGGIAPSSVILLGGAPGAGKSTLLSSIAGYLAQEEAVIYASAEESPHQIKARMDRMGINSDKLFLMTETNLEKILAEADRLDPIVLIIDSIQTIYTEIVESSAGTITQVRECASLLTNFAKNNGITVFIVSQMTKADSFAGPRILEHTVDTTLYLEGDENGFFRILRSIKNRLGPAPETAFLEMTSAGFVDITNPSEIFLSERNSFAAGTTIAAMIDGSKAMLVETQALVSNSEYANPSRSAMGFDRNRINKIADVLSKHANCEMSIRNIMVNIVGGIEGSEPALDLPMAIAMLSSMLGKVVPADVVSFGEIGLTGEFRSVSRSDLRIKEAEKIGMKHVIIPLSRRNQYDDKKINIIPMRNVKELYEWVDALPSDGTNEDKKTVRAEKTLHRNEYLASAAEKYQIASGQYLETEIP